MKKINTLMLTTGGIDFALALTYWALIFHGTFFYAERSPRMGVAYGLLLLLVLSLKWMANRRMIERWATRRPFCFAFLSVGLGGYLVFLAYGFASLWMGKGMSLTGSWASVFLLPFGFLVYGFIVTVPVWLAGALGLGCCARRMGRLA